MSPFDYRTFLDFAKYLYNSSKPSNLHEAAQRSVVSRAYYAAFLIARDYYGSNGGPITFSSKDHQYVRNFFQNKSQDIYDALEDLRKWRNLCDYDKNVSNLELLSKNAIKHAEKVIIQIKQLP